MSVRNRICIECGEALRKERRDYHFTESGLNNVVLKDVEMLVCDRCGIEIPRLPRLNDLMTTIALAIVAKPYKLEAQDVRFLRKFLDLTSERFAKILNVDKSHLSRVENGSTPVSDMADRLIRLVALGLGEGFEGKAKSIINRFKVTRQPKRLRLMVHPRSGSYEYRAA